MNLRELVNFRNELFKYSLVGTKLASDCDIKKILYLMQTQSFVSFNFVNDLEGKHKNIQETFDKFESSLDITKTYIQNLIKDIEPQWFEESSKRHKLRREYLTQLIHDNTTYRDDYGVARKGNDPKKTNDKNNVINQILNTSIKVSNEIRELTRSRVLKYTNWQFAGMIIRPGIDTFIDDMVANDPLYLIDEYLELLEPAMNKFNKSYQHRLRLYTDSTLDKLPDNQFAICLAYNYFDYMPIEVIERYLKEIFKKLHPGGVFAITFNDCDRPSGVELVEKGIAFYTPGNIIIKLAKNIGYQEIFKINDDGPTTWVELQKPGSLSSIRGGQTLAKIIHK